MLNKLRIEIDYLEMMADDASRLLNEKKEELANCSDEGAIKNILHDIEYHREECRKYTFALTVLRRIERAE